MGRGCKTLFISIIISVVLLITFAGILYYHNEIYLYKTDYLDAVMASAAKYNVDVYLIFAVIKVESAFNKDALSSAGAVGLMQIMPETAEYIQDTKVEIKSLLDPSFNIDTGVKYLDYLSGKFESLEWMLVGYNAGETKAREWFNEGIKPQDVPYKETRDYIIKVKKAMQRYRQLHYLY